MTTIQHKRIKKGGAGEFWLATIVISETGKTDLEGRRNVEESIIRGLIKLYSLLELQEDH